VGGDYISYGRFFVPLLPLTAWMLGTLQDDWLARIRRRWPKRRPWRVAAVLYLLAAGWTHFQIMDWAKRRFEDNLMSQWSRLGVALRDRLPDGKWSFYTLTAGVLPYRLGPRFCVHDALGLTDPVLAHEFRRMGRGYAGHEKTDPGRVLALRPSLVFVSFGPLPALDSRRLAKNAAAWLASSAGKDARNALKRAPPNEYREMTLKNFPDPTIFLVRRDVLPQLQGLFDPL
jgi:hypothetical protein